MSKSIFHFLPLGGLGKVGANMMIIKSSKESILIDAGILFPKDSSYGINFLIPDFYEEVSKHNINKLVITHGHEDHIGAVTFIAKAIPELQIYAPRFALSLIRKKLDESSVKAKLIELRDLQQIDFQDFSITPFEVTHSIPDSFGLCFQDHDFKHSLVYISDFKYNPSLSAKLKKVIKGSVSTFFCDSTNVLSKGPTINENDLYDGIKESIQKSKRTFITCFSSNIFRIQTILNAAAELSKRVVFYGRSLNFYVKQAMDLGLLTDPHSVIRDIDAVKTDAEDLVVIVTGCQGEFRGSLRRIATQDDSYFKPTQEDTFIFSSKVIPGNEYNVSYVINALSHVGSQIITSDDARIHATGHITSEELKQFYHENNFNYVIPIHGDTFFLRRHIDLIDSLAIHTKPLFVTNGDTLRFSTDGKLELIENEETLPLLIHGNNVELDRKALSERRKIAEAGIITISINLESMAKKKPKFKVTGVGLCQTSVDLLPSLDEFLCSYLKQVKIKSQDKTIDEIRVAIRRYFLPHTGQRPIAIVNFV